MTGFTYLLTSWLYGAARIVVTFIRDAIGPYCHVLSDCRRGIGLSTGFIGLQCTIYSYTLYNTTVYFTVFPRPSLFSAGPRTACRPNSLRWLFFEDCLSHSKSHYDRRPVGQCVLVSSPVWGSWPDVNYCLNCFVDIVRPLWREVGSVICLSHLNCFSSVQQICCWPSPAFDLSVFITPGERVAQLYPHSLALLLVIRSGNWPRRKHCLDIVERPAVTK
jgi:hypothetical protein